MTTNNTDLKPCPFCGGVGNLLQRSYHTYEISCSKCFIRTGGLRSLEAVLKRWNTRIGDKNDK